MESEILFDSGDVVITRSVARFGETSYQVCNISSANVIRDTRMNRLGAFLIGAGILLALIAVALGASSLMPFVSLPFDPSGYVLWAGVGAACAVVLGFLLQRLRPVLEFKFVMKTVAGETETLTTRDRTKAYDVRFALENAFILRDGSTPRSS